ncbi:MAG TPA: type II toxin-antitoxin system prevent-host-death family antitoxin [Candidatus Binataceae bacterium]|nr:type II toxin-antitoxin system prevent-host-death family antitoxin [Candidatus Binataceae bacterium]
MDTVGAFDAKTHLSELLDRVAGGETIAITRHGVPAALLVPARGKRRTLTRKEVAEGFKELRKRVKPAGISIREMIEEGRRH